MTLTCFTSQKGAPGTTLSALAIAAAWPTPTGRRKLFVEADPSGGSVALRYGLGLEPGLVTLAVAIRSGAHGAAVWDHAQELPGGLAAVVGPDSADRAGAALAAVGASFGRWLAQLGDVDVFVDLGRLDTDTHMGGCVAAADLTLMVARPCVEQLQPAAHAMAALPVEADRVAWLLIGERPHTAVEVADAFAWDVAGVIAHDRRSATDLETGTGGRRLRRSALVRSATSVAECLAARFAPPPDPEPAGGGTLAELVSQHTAGLNGADHDC